MFPVGWGVCEPMTCAGLRGCGTGEFCAGRRMEDTTALPVCAKVWDDGEYFTNLVGRYFETGGRDLPYYTQPQLHRCLETSTCPFMATTPR